MMQLDPDAQKVVDMIIDSGRPEFGEASVAETREVYAKSREVLQPPPRDIAEVRDLTAPGPGGDLPLRLYRDGPAGGQPSLVYFHGGGWVIGDLDSHDGVCRELAHRAQCTVISVDYRLAPEHVFPAAFDDAVAATRWIAANGDALGIDASRIAVGGDSAGGNLAAAVALDARDNGPELALQVLVYPATDMTLSMPSINELADQLPLKKVAMQWFVNHYMPEGSDLKDWRASPMHAQNFAGVAPAYVATAGFDPLRDEGEALAAKYEAAGVATQAKRYGGMVHGFLTMGAIIDETENAFQEITTALQAAFSR